MRTKFQWGCTAIVLTNLAFVTPAKADTFVSVCSRSTPFQNSLTEQLSKNCDQITAADLTTIKRVAVTDSNISAYNPQDMANLPNLEILNLNRNPLTFLPAKAFANLPKLATLVLIDVPLTTLPDDFLIANKTLVNLIMYKNNFSYIESHILARIEDLPALKVLQLTAALEPAEQNELTKRFPSGSAIDLSFPID